MNGNNVARRSNMDVHYDVDDKPPLREMIPLGLQHVLVMFSGNAGIPLILASAIDAPPDTRIFLIQAALLVAGLSTLIQAIGFGPIGARLPVVMGTSVGFVLVAVPVAQEYGLAAVYGGAVVAGAVQVAFGASIEWTRFLFPPLVTGIVFTIIGLSVLPLGIELAAGGAGASDFGHPTNLALSGFVTLVIVVVNQFTKGFTSLVAILIGIGAGYLVAIPAGMVDFSVVARARWFALPMPFEQGISFPLTSVVAMSVMSIAVTIETIGDLAAITESGAALIMFALVASTGIKILAVVTLNRRNMLIIAISLGAGLGVALVPESVRFFPPTIQAILETGIVQATFLAIILNLVLPEELRSR